MLNASSKYIMLYLTFQTKIVNILRKKIISQQNTVYFMKYPYFMNNPRNIRNSCRKYSVSLTHFVVK